MQYSYSMLASAKTISTMKLQEDGFACSNQSERHQKILNGTFTAKNMDSIRRN
jgi:hypothetical protein